MANLLTLVEEIQEAIREGALSERDSRVYQKLEPNQQRALFQAHMAGEVNYKEVREVSKRLKDAPEQSVGQVIRVLRQPIERDPIARQDDFVEQGKVKTAVSPSSSPTSTPQPPLPPPDLANNPILPPRSNSPNSVQRLDWVRGHLAKVQRQGLSERERREMLRLLYLIEQDISSLISTLAVKE